MRQIVPGKLWIGHALDTRNPEALFEANVAAVVDLAYKEPPASLPRGLVYCRFPLIDGAGNDPRLLRLAVETVVRLLAECVSNEVGIRGFLSREAAKFGSPG